MEEKNVKRPNKSKVILATVLPIGIIATLGAAATAGIMFVFKRKVAWPAEYRTYISTLVEKISLNSELNVTLKIKDEYKPVATFPAEINVEVGTGTLDKENYIWSLSDDKSEATLIIKSKYIKSNINVKAPLNITGYRVIKGGSDASLWTDIPEDCKYAYIGKEYEVEFAVGEGGKAVQCPGLPSDKKNVQIKIGGFDPSYETWSWTVTEPGTEEGYCNKAKVVLTIPDNHTGDMEIIITKK